MSAHVVFFFLLFWPAFSVRLSKSYWGRVEVKHLGVWGSVCAGRSWNDSAANITCKQIGKAGGVK